MGYGLFSKALGERVLPLGDMLFLGFGQTPGHVREGRTYNRMETGAAMILE